MGLRGKLIYDLKQAGKRLIPDSLLPLARSLRRQLTASRRNKKRNSGQKTERADLVLDLTTAGFSAGQMVMVHASLSSIGNVSGGARTVIESWLEVITLEGTILMPCYNSAEEMERKLARGQLIDLRSSRSLTGQISETFRLWTKVQRSSHPFSSTCAWGKKAAWVSSAHDSAPLVCHLDSPIGRLVEADGIVVGIGIPIAQGLGVAHYLEDTWPEFPFEVHADPRQVTYIDANGNEISRLVSRFDPQVARTRLDQPEGGWINDELTGHLALKGILHEFNYGEGKAWWMNARELYKELKKLAKKGVTMYSTRQQLTDLDQLPDNW